MSGKLFRRLKEELNGRRDVGWLHFGTDRFGEDMTTEIEMAVLNICNDYDPPPTPWTPVSAGLPEDKGVVLVTPHQIVRSVDLGCLINGCWISAISGEPFKHGVRAWSPLPEPWTGGDS